MPSLTLLDSTHGFSDGDLNTDGYIAVIPAFQKVYFADGRAYDDKGYHKLDFVNTKIVGTANTALKRGEAVVQTTSGATGFYEECTDVKLSGTLGDADVPFLLGEKVTQPYVLTADSESYIAIGYVVYVGNGFINVCPVSRDSATGALIDFEVNANIDSGGTVTGATSDATYSVPSVVSAIGLDKFHFIYRTSTTEFDEDNDITGAISGGVIEPLTADDSSPDVGACIQHLYPDATASSGSFTITYKGKTTDAIAAGATTATIKTALEALSTVAVDDIAVSGTTFDSGDEDNPLILTFKSTLGSVSPVSVTETMGTTTAVTTKILQTGFTTITAPPHWLTWKPVASFSGVTNPGIMPDGGSNIGVLCFGRIFLNSMSNPHHWVCTRIGDPLDFDTSKKDVGAATTSQNTPKAGLVGAPIIAMVSYKDHYLTMGCTNSVYVMRSDPLMGGVNTPVSESTGFFSPVSWCWDDQNNLYFLGIDGIYRLTSDAIISNQPPGNLTKQNIPKLISSTGLNRRTDKVAMAYDKKRFGIEVSVTQRDGGWATVFWLDLRTGGLFPDKFPTGQSPASMMYLDSRKASDRTILYGGYDGYIRKPDDTAKNDEGDNAIDSFFTIGPYVDDTNPRNKIETGETSLTLGEDTDGITFSIFRADSGDELIKSVIAGATPAATKTLTGDGLKSSIRERVSGRAIVMKLSNSESSESFSIESINTKINQSGKEK